MQADVDFGTYPAAPTASSPVFDPADIGDGDAPPAVDTGCPYAVSEGDVGVGSQLVGDATCVKGGVGCFADVCHFCRYRDTPQPNHLAACKDLGVVFRSRPSPATLAPATAPPLPTLHASTPTTMPTTVSIIAPVSVPTNTPAPVPQAPGDPVVERLTGCPYLVSDGDFKVGIQLVGDVTCAAGGIGCFKDLCRYCKFQDTPQSSHLLNGSDFGYPRTQAPTFTPVDIVDPAVDPAVDLSTRCAYPVTDGDMKVGTQLVGDVSCVAGDLDCFKDVCRAI